MPLNKIGQDQQKVFDGTEALEDGDLLVYDAASGDFQNKSKAEEDIASAAALQTATDKLDGIEAGATADQTGAEIKAAYEGEADTNAFDDAAVSKLAGIEAGAEVNTINAGDNVSVLVNDVEYLTHAAPLVAHGAMFEPVAANDLTTPATVANQFTINAGQYRVNGTLVDLPATLVTLSAAPATAGLLSRKDLVYLQEDGTVGTYTGTDDDPTMADAGFSAVAGEVGLWVNGGVYAIPLFTVQRRNQGAYHPYFNEWGTATWWTVDGVTSNNRDWYDRSGNDGNESTTYCFINQAGGASLTSRGAIGQSSGRPDDKFYDAIYASDVTDLRLQAITPSATQLSPNYWQNKAVAGALKHFVTEGIPKLVVKERGVVETGTTTTAGGTQVGDRNNYATGDFVILINQDGAVKNYGYITRITSAADTIYCYTTFTDAVKNASANGTGAKTFARVNSDVYTILKVEYTPATFADNTWTDIIGDPANYPRQATGVIDHLSSIGSTSVVTGDAVEVDALTTGSGTIGNVYIRLISGGTFDLRTADYTNSANWLDLGPKATFLANATGLEGFPLLYGENGEDLIPDGTSKAWKFKRKGTDHFINVYSSDKGVSYASDNTDIVTNAENSWVASYTADRVLQVVYKTPAHIFSDAANSSVLGGKLSTCYASNYATATVGGAYISELISKVLTAVINPIGLNKTVEDYAFLVAGDIYPNAFNKPTHAVLGLNDNNSSPAGKVVNYLHDTGPNIELFSVFKEMIFDSGKDRNDVITADSSVSASYSPNNLYHFTAGDFQGDVYQNVANLISVVLDGTYARIGDELIRVSDGFVAFKLWDGNGWGDDNTFLFADNTPTDIDDNGNTILVGTKSTKLPIVGGS